MAKNDDKPDVYVNFTGMKTAGDFDVIPDIGEVQTFTVKARCVSEPHKKLMADGHKRTVLGMAVLEVEPGTIEPAPEGDPMLPLDGGEPEDSE
jgi:hypothetical protein